MEIRKITEHTILEFGEYLALEEKSERTIEKYLRDLRAFFRFVGEKALCKEQSIAYKQRLLDAGYAARSVNSMLAAVNRLFQWKGWNDLRVKTLKLQRQIYCPEERELTKEEYLRLVRTAEAEGKEQLSLLLQTICATGIRVSELPFITVEAARRGEAVVSCKGKTRTVFLVRGLQKKLLRFAAKQKIHSGSLFCARNGEPLNRTAVWRQMKQLCGSASVNPAKVFPHNLRHLFARVFYQIEKDIVKLADVLGHSSIDTTRLYIRSTGIEHRRKMEGMRLLT